MNMLVTSDFRSSRNASEARVPTWWPWAVLALGIIVILVGGILFTPGA
jgi:hypothetical protein